MEVLSVNNNCSSLGFGAKIKFASGDLKKTLVSSSNFAEADKLLDRIENIHKNDVIKVGVKRDDVLGPVIYAINLRTKKEVKERTLEDNYHNKIGNSESFYKLIKDLTDPSLMLYRDFWLSNPYDMPHVDSGKYKDVKHYDNPMEHSVFIA